MKFSVVWWIENWDAGNNNKIVEYTGELYNKEEIQLGQNIPVFNDCNDCSIKSGNVLVPFSKCKTNQDR